jgi:hypothetical protein
MSTLDRVGLLATVTFTGALGPWGCAAGEVGTEAEEVAEEAEDEVLASFADDPGYDPQSDRGTACRMACAVAGTAGCGAITAACTGVTVITIGGFALPCVWAAVAACATAAGGIVLCQEKACPP